MALELKYASDVILLFDDLGGTVKLAKTVWFFSSARSARARSAGARRRIPRDERLGSQQPVVNSSQ